MALDERKQQCITYLLEGYTITDISKLLNCSRQTIYNWLEDEEFKTELDKRGQEIADSGNKKILKDVEIYINKLKLLATKADSEKVQLDATRYLLDRVYGVPSSKVNLDMNKDNDNKDSIDKDILADILDDDDNIIDISEAK